MYRELEQKITISQHWSGNRGSRRSRDSGQSAEAKNDHDFVALRF